MTVLVIVLVVAAAVALLALAWWWSGRSRGTEYNPLAAAERGEAEYKAMKEYNPASGFGGGPGA